MIALGRLRAHPNISLPALYGALKDESVSVRQYAIAALGEFSVSEAEFLEHVIAALWDEDALVREFAATILSGLSSMPNYLIPDLVDVLQHQDPHVFRQIKKLLQRLASALGLDVRQIISSVQELKALQKVS